MKLSHSLNRLPERISTNYTRRNRKSCGSCGRLVLVIFLCCIGIFNHYSRFESSTTSHQNRLWGAAGFDSTREPKIVVPEILRYNLPSKTSMVILNIGSNIDPILPRAKNGPCARAFAFEPVVPDLVPNHPQLTVIPAAVSNSSSADDGGATSTVQMQVYNHLGVSSSIYQVASRYKQKWGKGDTVKNVPLVSLTQVLDAVPAHIPIKLLMTDIQGHDFSTVSSAIDKIQQRQIPFLRTEVSLDGSFSYEGAKNDLCTDWLPFMLSHGYEFDGLYPNRTKEGWGSVSEILRQCEEERRDAQRGAWAGLKELDALWRRSGVTLDMEAYQYPVHSQTVWRPNKHLLSPNFTAEEYASCS